MRNPQESKMDRKFVIPFNRPFISGREKEYLEAVFETGHFAGNGPFTKRCQTWLEDHLGATKVLLTHSCTGALELASLLADIGPDDEFIVPSFTFVTTASAFMRTGAKPVFCEVDPTTMLMNLDDVEKRITSRTKAIIPVDYAGFAPDMDRLSRLAEENDLIVIEDAAQGLGSSMQGTSLGTFTPMAALSFHETKNIHCGLGGCLVVNDVALSDRAEIIWERGTNRSAFFKGLVDKYSWVELGSSFYPSEFQAAFLLAQLEAMEENLIHRRMIWNGYADSLSGYEQKGDIQILRPPSGLNHNAHMFAIFLPTPQKADSVRQQLGDQGVQAVIHYVPLHESAMGAELGYAADDLPVTTHAASCLLRLPMHAELEMEDVSLIADILSAIL